MNVYTVVSGIIGLYGEIRDVNFYYFYVGGEVSMLLVTMATIADYYFGTFGNIFEMPQYARFLSDQVPDVKVKKGKKRPEAPFWELAEGKGSNVSPLEFLIELALEA